MNMAPLWSSLNRSPRWSWPVPLGRAIRTSPISRVLLDPSVMFCIPNDLVERERGAEGRDGPQGVERAVVGIAGAGNRLVVVGVAPVRHVVRLVDLVAPGVGGWPRSGRRGRRTPTSQRLSDRVVGVLGVVDTTC